VAGFRQVPASPWSTFFAREAEGAQLQLLSGGNAEPPPSSGTPRGRPTAHLVRGHGSGKWRCGGGWRVLVQSVTGSTARASCCAAFPPAAERASPEKKRAAPLFLEKKGNTIFSADLAVLAFNSWLPYDRRAWSTKQRLPSWLGSG
jgi:hypothetical protein